MQIRKLHILAVALLLSVQTLGCSDDNGGGPSNNGGHDAGADATVDGTDLRDAEQDGGADANNVSDAGNDSDLSDADDSGGGDTSDGGDVLVDAGGDADSGADVAPPPPDDLDPLVGQWSHDFSAPGMLDAQGGSVKALLHDDSTDAVYAGGSFTVAGTASTTNIAKWNGANWEAMGMGLPSAVTALAQDASGTVYAATAGGSGGMIGQPTPAGIFTWDGTQWTPLAQAGGQAVHDMVTLSNGDLIVAGEFQGVDRTAAANIVRLTGSGWQAIDRDMQPNDVVYDVEPTVDGFCMVGAFTKIGTMDANHAACWDGTTWSPMGAGLDSEVFALVSLGGGEMLAGGNFGVQDANGNSVLGLAKWDGSSWAPFAGGVAGGTQPTVRRFLKTASGSIYVGGAFTVVGGSTVSTGTVSRNIALLDGTTWTALDQGVSGRLNSNNGLGGGVQAIATLDNGDVIAGGVFTDASGTFTVNIARYDGTSWDIFVNSDRAYLAVGGTVGVLAEGADGAVYAGGDFEYAGQAQSANIAKIDGNHWVEMGNGLNDIVHGIAVDGATVYAGGEFQYSGVNGVSWVAQWDGTVWNRLGGGLNGPVEDLAVGPNGNLYAVGSFTLAEGQTVNGVAMWDGTSWHALGDGFADVGTGRRQVEVFAVAVDDAGTVYAGGEFVATASGTEVMHVAQWDGTQWSALGAGVTDDDPSTTGGDDDAIVYDIAMWDDKVVLGGRFAWAGGNTVNSITVWDGTSYQAMGEGAPPRWEGGRPGLVLSVTTKANGVFATAGETLGSATVNFVGWWDGSAWSALDEGVNDSAEAVLVSNHRLYVGGAFTAASGIPSLRMARWDYAPTP